MSAFPWLLNTAWTLKCSREAAAFASASRRVAETQSRLLCEILAANRDTEFGRRHRFEAITGAGSYQERVPPATYDDFAGSIRRIAAGGTNILTSEPVRLLEPTSGTTGGEKLVPYTDGLRRQFQRGVAAWIHDLFRRRPAIRGGRAYWSVSPWFGPRRRSPGGLLIGFDDDAAYLGRIEQFALRRLLVAPGELARLPQLESFRYCTLLHLLAAADLTMISVWSPTFLTALLAPLESWKERLCRDLREGTARPPTPLSPETAALLRPFRGADPRRADCVARALRAPAQSAERLGLIWPRLALISCWADAAAAGYAAELRTHFPGIEILPKGLLSTEAFVSLPLFGRDGAALSVRSHFFEFEESGSTACRLAHELERGGRYRVVTTTAGGLYRYQLRDEVEVTGHFNECPLIRFIGKSDATSDLVGEKLAEPHVRAMLDRCIAAREIHARFMLLAPVTDQPARYRLYIQAPGLTGDSPLLERLRKDLEEGLMENPYYRHAVALGQLAPAEVSALDPEGVSAWLLFEKRCLADGARCGNIKPVALDRRSGWPQIFEALLDQPATGHRPTA
jgi:hypothetical protein